MDNQIKPRVGAPHGNCNSLKHGYYSRALKKPDKKELELAASVRGVDEEIALLRLKIKSALKSNPDDFRFLNQAILSLNRLLRTRLKMGTDRDEHFLQAIRNVIRDAAVPLGLRLDPVIRPAPQQKKEDIES